MDRPPPRRWDGELMENGAFYLFTAQTFKRSGSRLSGKVIAHEMAAEAFTEARRGAAGQNGTEECRRTAVRLPEIASVHMKIRPMVMHSGSVNRPFCCPDSGSSSPRPRWTT